MSETEEMREERGLLFPADLDVPDQEWFRIQFDNNTVHDLGPDGYVYLARQRGLERFDSELVESGIDDNGLRYASVKVSVVIDGESYAGIGGADETSHAVRDPEYVTQVAETRALKRAIKRALGVRDAHDPDGTGRSPPAGSDGSPAPPAHPDVPDDMTEDPPEPEPEAPDVDTGDDDPAW